MNSRKHRDLGICDFGLVAPSCAVSFVSYLNSITLNKIPRACIIVEETNH